MKLTTINERVKHVRKLLGKSQRDFASELMIKQGSLSDIERGRNGVSAKINETIIQKFKVNSGWLNIGQGDIFSYNFQGKDSGSIQGLSTKNEKNRVYPGEHQAIKDVYNLVEKLYEDGMESPEIKKIIYKEVEKLDDKTLSYYLRSNNDIREERKDLSEALSAFSDIEGLMYLLNQIIETYIVSVKNSGIEFTDYQTFKESRIKIFEKIAPFKIAVEPLIKAIKTFIKAVEPLDTQGIINND